MWDHIQDGGSTDDTPSVIEDWIRKNRNRSYACKGVSITLASEKDSGMYQAINRGFSQLPVSESTLMTWINADDLIAYDAFATAFAAIRDIPEIDWLCSQLALVDEAGNITNRWDPGTYSRTKLRHGLYTGRNGLPFVQQEGTFWRPKLWKAVGGLNESFRLAGDWDLWRRFADFSSATVLEATTGFHRRRSGQLSADLSRYHQEVDAYLATLAIPDMPTPEAIQRIAYNPEKRSWQPIAYTRDNIVGMNRNAHTDDNAYMYDRKKSWLSRFNRRRLEWKRKYFGRKTQAT